MSFPGQIAALAGGVGAARFLRGLVRVVPAEDVVAIVNTGDDRVFYGVHVSPDLDIVTYTLAGRVDYNGGDVRFSIQGGEGLGRYVALGISSCAVVDASGQDIEAIPTISGNLAMRRVLGSFSLSAGVSGIHIDNDVALTGPEVTANSRTAHLSLLRYFVPGLTVGGEMLFGTRELENGETGDIQRVTFSIRKGF